VSILHHEKVAEHYNRIRYPRYPWVFWGRWRDLERIDLQSWCAQAGGTRPVERAWLCGAGTIQPLLFGRRNPSVRFLVSDLSARSLRESKIRCALHGILNMEFRCQDLFDSNSVEEFDAIDAYGVLHHTKDPVLGLSILARALKRQGILRLMLYSTKTRKYLEEVRSELLSQKSDWSDKEVLDLLRSRSIPLVGDLASKDGRIDALLHPLVHTFDDQEIEAFVKTSGLKIVRRDSEGNHLLFLKK